MARMIDEPADRQDGGDTQKTEMAPLAFAERRAVEDGAVEAYAFGDDERLHAVIERIAAAARADAWNEGAEATAEWSASYMHGDNGLPDPPRNPYERDRPLAQPSRPFGSSNTEGEEDGKQGGVHSEHSRRSALGTRGAGLHARPGVLAGSGPDPHGQPEGRSGQGLSTASPGDYASSGERRTPPTQSEAGTCHGRPGGAA